MKRSHSFKLFCLFLVLFTLIAEKIYADNYFFISFAVDDKLHSFTGAHTFGVFVKTTGTEPAIPSTVIDSEVISWLPRKVNVCLFCQPEPGRNFKLHESIDEGVNKGSTVSYWGPYQVKEELYLRAKKKVEFLNSGQILFQAIDNFNRPKGISTNCEHALSDVDTDHGLLQTGTKHGSTGTRHVTKHLSKWFIEKNKTYSWLLRALSIDKYPLKKKTL